MPTVPLALRSGHVIHSLGHALQQLGLNLLNDITWEKPNPPPNLACRCFTHSTETFLWAERSDANRHTFNYSLMRSMNGGVQMKTVWSILGPGAEEKLLGEHPPRNPSTSIPAADWPPPKPGISFSTPSRERQHCDRLLAERTPLLQD